MSEEHAMERRAIDVGTLIAMIQQVHDDVRALDSKLTIHILEEVEDISKAVQAAFEVSMPNNNPGAHRLEHEYAANAMRASSEFWNKLLFELAKTGLIGALGWLTYAAWSSLVTSAQR